MIRCGVCDQPIHTDHDESDLRDCLKVATIYIKDLNELVNKVLILNGAGSNFAK